MTQEAAISEAERLAAYEEIKKLKARYFRAVDTDDWDMFARVYTPDAKTGPNDKGEYIEGPDAITARVRGALDGVPTLHEGHSPEIELISPTTATGIWAQEDQVWDFPKGAGGTFHGYGHYHDTYVKFEGEWRIATSRLDRIRVETT